MNNNKNNDKNNNKQSNFNVIDEIKKLETKYTLSNTQKILLATDGSVTTILDVLKGTVNIKTLVQEYQKADENIAKQLNIEEGEEVNYRVVIIKREDEPLIYASSYIPLKRVSEEFKEDLIRADIPIGRILKSHKIESRREVQATEVKPSNEELKRIFKTEVELLSRKYNIIHKDNILFSIEETFPIDSFTGDFK